MKFTVVCPIHNEEQYISSWLQNTDALNPSEIIIGLDRCTDRTEEIIKKHLRRNKPKAKYILKQYDDTPNGYNMRAAGIRRDLYQIASNNIIVNTAADILIDTKVCSHLELIGSYGLISFGYFDYPWNIQSFLRYIISKFTLFHGFAGLLAFSRDAWLETEDLTDLKTIYRAEDTHLQLSVMKKHRVKHINTKSLHLRPNETKQDHYLRGVAQFHYKKSIMMNVIHGVVMFRPAVVVGYRHASQGLVK
jgi:glycosyltransferase involved in cell wall biosynthesis